MFRKMRRSKQELPIEQTEQILVKGITGVLGVVGDEGYPYTVPLNYVYQDKSIYFHCAKAGHKLDAIKNNGKVSFCVIAKEEIVPEEFTAYFKSAIVFGKAQEVTEDDEKLRIMRLLNNKYAPGLNQAGEKAIEKEWNILCVVKINVEHMSGKEAIELVRKRSEQM